MKITKKQLDLQKSLQKEWIITNGIGGYASSTILGCNTRRYHGLLVAPLNPPANRTLILSKIDESILIDNEKFDLYTNICENYISDGYKNLESFEKNPLPEFNYKIKNVKINKKISFIYGKNTVVINYLVKNPLSKNIKLILAPIVNFRNFHDMSTNSDFLVNQEILNNEIKLNLNNNVFYIYANDGKYIKHDNDVFKNMYYIKEEERGFFPKENLCVPGVFEIEINKYETKNITIVALLEELNNFEIDSKNIFEQEENRINEIIKNTKLISNKVKLTGSEKSENEFLRDLIIASDNFVINRPEFGLHSIIAGYPWFLDWGRDTAISFEGLLLITRRYDLAKEILLMLTKDIKQGLVPNGYSESDGKPLYNSVDSSLLLFEQVNKFLKYTKDYDFVKENIYEKLKNIIENYQKGIDLDGNNIYIDKEDNLLVSGTPNIQNTWMDAKIGDYVVTPRNGKAVEINSLWYNALKTMEFLAKKYGEKDLSDNYKKIAKKHKESFEEKFYNKSRKSLYDVIYINDECNLGDEKIRPNQLFSISTTYPVINPASFTGKTIFETVKKKLYTKYGLRTLSKDDNGYIDEYSGDSYKRDTSYHQGICWVWLLGLYADSLENIIDSEKDRIEKEKYIIEKEKLIETTYNTFKKELYEKECIGNISEVYDAKLPVKPGGTCAQAWSVSEILKIVTRKEE